LTEIHEATDYVAMVKREARLHVAQCQINSAMCDICCNFDKRLPQKYPVEQRLQKLWQEAQSLKK
jgi:hypothetical protein